ncbi:putative protein phosphatase 2C [Trifolium repens]|nr:putative protein phosphatase 2C [Trifolium repens]
MGNRISSLCLCSAGTGEISGRLYNSFALLSKKHDKAICNSISYVRPNPPGFSGDTFSEEDDDTLVTFRSVFGATVSANSSSTSSIFLDDSLQHSTVLDSSASFESFGSFTSTMMHPQHQNDPPRSSSVCGSIEKGLSWSPFNPMFNDDDDDDVDSIEKASEHVKIKKPNKISLKKVLSRVFSNTISSEKGSIFKNSDNVNANARVSCSTSLSDELRLHNNNYLDDYDDGGGYGCENLHMAQGKGGEDRMHIVICEEHGWVYVGIYDGFNGPDATDYLLNNMFYAVHDELKGFLCNRNRNSSNKLKSEDVLEALSEAMRKTEDAFLKIINEMINHNPVLAMMGSCVLVMLMKGEDVYLMNVGDSRAVLATRIGNHPQLTMDHSTHVKEEVYRIRQEHPDDPSAVTKGRVKGYLNITRAFGAGFLKQPKQNDAMLETFKVNYIGESPYIICSPSLHHQRLSSSDKFLILSSDGLYQYFTNEEAVAKVESFIAMFPDKNPAQLLIEEALSQAAKKAGMEFHELLDIPQGERRLYHDDISIVIISLEGKIWRSLV